MSKQFNKFLIKILLLSSFMVLAFNLWNNILNASTDNINNVNNISNITKNDNNSSFKKINTSSLWKIWVAITTNIWIRYKQRLETPATIYKDIFSVNEIIVDQKLANKELIWANMLAVDEYKNILKTNIKQLVDSSIDKAKILNAFIEQLEFRYTLSAQNMKKLNEQKVVFETTMTSANTKIDTLKIKIDKDFKNSNSVESLANINTYLSLKKEYYYAKTYIIYINRFLWEYNYLNEYNKLLLDTLINNKEAIIKNTYVVIPDSGTKLLKEFNLIYSEEEYKKQ